MDGGGGSGQLSQRDEAAGQHSSCVWALGGYFLLFCTMAPFWWGLSLVLDNTDWAQGGR